VNKNYELWIYRPEKCIFPIFCVCILLLLLDARRSRWLNIKRQLAHANLRHVSSGPCRLTTMWAAGCEFNKSGSPRTRITDSHPLGRLGKFESPARLAKLPQVAGVSSLVSLFFLGQGLAEIFCTQIMPWVPGIAQKGTHRTLEGIKPTDWRPKPFHTHTQLSSGTTVAFYLCEWLSFKCLKINFIVFPAQGRIRIRIRIRNGAYA